MVKHNLLPIQIHRRRPFRASRISDEWGDVAHRHENSSANDPVAFKGLYSGRQLQSSLLVDRNPPQTTTVLSEKRDEALD